MKLFEIFEILKVELRLKLWCQIKIVTWNVWWILLKTGNLAAIEKPITQFSIPGPHWKRWGIFYDKQQHIIYYSDNGTQSRNGVSIIANKANKRAIKYTGVSNRNIVLGFPSNPMNRNVIQAYPNEPTRGCNNWRFVPTSGKFHRKATSARNDNHNLVF